MPISRFKAFLSCIMLWSVVAGKVHADEYPEYQGVYVYDVQTEDWVPLASQRLEWFQLVTSKPIAQFNYDGRGFMKIGGLSQSTLERSPSIAKPTELRIFVRSRNPQLVFVDFVVTLNDMVASMPPGDSQFVQEPPGSILFKPAPDMVLSKFGFPANNFRVKLVDNTSAEYVLDASMPVPDIFYGFSQCSTCELEVQGLAVSTIEVGDALEAPSRFMFQLTE